jgi:nucleotide-binding universal stress UspA family protein
MFEHIFVPTDFSPPAEHALGIAIEMAKKLGSRITLVHACEPPAAAYMSMMTVDLITPLQDAARTALKEAFDALKPRHAASESLLLFGVAAMELLAAIEKHKPDLVVMGTHGRTGVSRFLLGSIAERLVRTSPVPVLTVRHH